MMNTLLPVSVIIAGIASLILNLLIVPAILKPIRHRLMMDSPLSEEPPDIKRYLRASIIIILCVPVVIGPLLYVVHGDNFLGKQERQWQAYVEQQHCKFVSEETIGNAVPLTTWQCHDGLHQVNVAVHQTKQGIAVGGDITLLRRICYVLSAIYLLVAVGEILLTMRQYYLYKRLWRQMRTNHTEGQEKLS
ncbi:hypothetical protein [Cardiobacterium valvarum]|uniref:Uncharacterized protein n=1 Tax=Cardiobacterium valvarum TaxID=194702 RepID=A0A381E7M6_9GAMM|nr:hypothetical protein [Cardiobacterium valvarum]SUX22704.1 Uncharacterised protein [Cardiobacterium valvarum]